jgi:hypothetical protein
VAHGRDQITPHRLGRSLPLLRLLQLRGHVVQRRAERVQLGSRVEPAHPRLEVALTHAPGRAIEPGHGRRGRASDHEGPGDAGGGRVEEEHGDERRVVLAHRHAVRQHADVRDRDHGREQRDGHEALSHRGARQQEPREHGCHDRDDAGRHEHHEEVGSLPGAHAHRGGDDQCADDPGGRDRDDERDGWPEPPRSPAIAHGSNRYPTPHTVTRREGFDGSSSIFSRRRRM